MDASSSVECAQMISDPSHALNADPTSKSQTSDCYENGTRHWITSSCIQRQRSTLSTVHSSTVISQRTTRSLSADDVNKIPCKRRERFREQLRNLIESGIYNSLTERTLDEPYSAATIRGINAYARDLRFARAYVANTRSIYENASRGINALGTERQSQLSGPSMPLSITLKKESAKVTSD
ncbi:hypothetical protein Tcan_05254 [Toxocara canis]|uniref:Uncharacterized protein n=1 Tax=Toxocara canis TaxID=6265 RepID=A0A0B2UWG0_TOXCA|nr:hypothetical protein Tcan_05254 [Toxocara canis]